MRWFGGEPLLRPDIIDQICDGLLEAGTDFRSECLSNGSLFTPQILEKMLDRWNLRSIQISMDGSEEDYIARKRYPGNKDRYHSVLESINRMSEAGILVFVRSNVDEDNWNSVPAFIADLDRFIANKKNVRVYFSPLGGVRTGERDIPLWEKTIKARKLIADAGFRPADYLGTKLQFRTYHCMADAGSVVIAPDGSLYACDHCLPESRFGDIYKGITDVDARTEFCRTDRTRDKCRNCTFLPECTSFSTCPWKDTHCRELRKMLTLEALKRELDQEAQNREPDEDNLVC